PRLLPEQPVASTPMARSQQPEPLGKVTPVSTSYASTSRPEPTVALRIRASVNGMPITEEELREALAQHLGEILAVPESMRGEAQRQMSVRELDRLVERELILQDAMERLKALKRPKLIEELQREASKEADKRMLDVKKAIKTQTDAEFKAALQNQGLTIAGMRRQVERNYMMTEDVRSLILPVANRVSLQ